MMRSYAVFLLAIGLGIAASDRAHGQAPITALPRPVENATPMPQPQPPQADQQPAPESPSNSVHPITSLPKPPGTNENPPAYVPPTPQPVAIPDATTTPIPTSVAPAQPATAPAVAYPTPNVMTSTPQDAIVPPPQPTPEVEQPLHANVGGEVPSAPAINHPVVKDEGRVHAFSTVGAQFKASIAGIGFDIATPLAQHFNLRAGGSIFTYAGSYDDSGNHIVGTAQLRSGSLYVEYFPWSHSGFHINAGVVFDGNYMNGTSTVAAGTEFDLGDGKYYSSASDPVHGTVKFDFGKTVAPSFTLGFGNIVPRSKKHFSFPFEIGFMYTGYSPNLQMTLVGSVCDTSNPPNCQKIDNDPEAQADLKKELDDINSNIKFLKFYPIISQGISIKF